MVSVPFDFAPGSDHFGRCDGGPALGASVGLKHQQRIPTRGATRLIDLNVYPQPTPTADVGAVRDRQFPLADRADDENIVQFAFFRRDRGRPLIDAQQNSQGQRSARGEDARGAG